MRLPTSNELIASIAVALIMGEGAAIAKLMRDNRNVVRRTNFLVSVIERNNVDLDEFELIAAEQLGFLKKDVEEEIED
jgi:hypothetical protein